MGAGARKKKIAFVGVKVLPCHRCKTCIRHGEARQ